MRNKLAITVFMIGLAGGASAQQYYHAGSTDTALKTDAQLNDNSKSSSKGDNNERKKEHCEDSVRVSEERSNSAPNHPHPDRKDSGKSQSPEQAAQNTIEYGG